MGKTLIEQIKDREISTKDLIKLKFFHLMNYFTFIIPGKTIRQTKGKSEYDNLKELNDLLEKFGFIGNKR